MRRLSNSELNSVTGAGYSEDIVTAAASIYVGTFIGREAAALSAFAFAGAANLIGTAGALAPLGNTVGMLGSIVSPIMFFAAPLLVFDAVYPGVIAEKAGAYFN